MKQSAITNVLMIQFQTKLTDTRKVKVHQILGRVPDKALMIAALRQMGKAPAQGKNFFHANIQQLRLLLILTLFMDNVNTIPA